MFRKALYFVLTFTILLTCSSIALAQNQNSSPIGLPKIVYIEGSVSVNLDGTNWIPAEKGKILTKDSVVKTLDKSYCDIAFDQNSKNIVSLGPNTELKIGEHLKRVSISKGRVFAKMGNLEQGSKFEIAAPQAISGVRGTEWESIVDSTVKFNVNKSTIYVQGIGTDGAMTGESDVKEGLSIVVDNSGWLGELEALTEEDKDRMEQWSNRIDQVMTLSHQRGCCSLIDSFDGGSSNLFEQVLRCEAGLNQESFAAASPSAEAFDLPQDPGPSDQGLMGSDLTVSTFSESPAPSNPIQEPTTQPCQSNTCR